MRPPAEGESPGLYVHVPFCRSKCPYCDFYSVTAPCAVADWLSAIEREAAFYAGRFGQFETLYLGGGTPTSLTDSQLSRLIGSLAKHFAFSRDAEITLESNPDDITPERLAHFSSLGVNRISLGIQSMHDAELAYLGRKNTAKQNAKALQWVRSRAALQLAVDLIYAFEGQTRESWRDTLEFILTFQPEHLSCYQLTVEEATPFGGMQREGTIRLPSDDEQSDRFLMTSSFIESNGYIHYEISNFAKTHEHRSRHNSKYWRHVPYLGLGPSAHSFQGGTRWWNVRSVGHYCQALSEGRSPVMGRENLSRQQLELEILYLGLRTRDGVDVRILPDSPRVRQALAQLQAAELVRLHQGMLRPTRKGFLIADGLPLMLLD